MARNADETRRKILDAATEEFARHGIAGARVDRITKNAGVNNALLYRYFGSKIDLFDAVYSRLVLDTVDAVPMDPADLPDYAGRLYDYYESHPDVVRLAAWRQLERPEQELPEAVHEGYRARTDKIAQAQRDGLIPDAMSAAELRDLMILLSLSNTPLMPAMGSAIDRKRRRATIVAAAAAVLRSG
ncbi:TetR family transcriptional regulator [Kutzneria sp. CA-103260]|uniref:TetR family transcriptional regulator n=1 Tax=Kutzneria sp. CA-103260 TaxID=2802641 RepID=UPI001BACD67D|nr:TetR family transcriptional regulator [Kutzneria sp. CA-103260]QUQ68789.1 tetR family regulatory protein [Kutzneria sp. CA-103260]